MIKLEDTLGIHSFYFKSTLGMVRTYLAMHEDPAPASAEQIAYDSMTKEVWKSTITASSRIGLT